MKFTVRLLVPVFGLVVVAGASAELFVSGEFRRDPEAATRRYCGYFLCDERDVFTYAYDLQEKATPASLAKVTSLLELSLEQDPAAPRRWADLADVLAFRGEVARARQCYDRASALGSGQVGILVNTAYFHLRYGDHPYALRCLSRVLTLAPGAMDEVLFAYMTPRRGVTMDDILANGVPRDKRAAQAYLRFLLKRGAAAEAAKVWSFLEQQGLVDDKAALDYIDFLMHRSMASEGFEVWTRQFGSRQPGYRASNYLYNSDFESKTTGSQFDWSMDAPKAGEVRLDAKAHSGRSSVYVRFGGQDNIDWAGVRQETMVPGGRYRFQAYLCSDRITTDEGVFFRITGGDVGGINVQTEQVVGTTEWHPVSATFTVPPGSHLLEVWAMRKRSEKFDNKIGGSVWIDQATLTRE